MNDERGELGLIAEPKKESAIERHFPSKLVSRVGTNERYFHGRTPHSVHVWWARRPFSAMRAVVFASLAPAEDPDVFSMTEELCASVEPSPLALSAAQNVLLEAYGGRPPRVLDMFGGGGTIALEAARLGCAAISLDVNPLACFVQRTLLQYSQAHPAIPTLVRTYGEKLLRQLEWETDKLYRRSRLSTVTGKPLVFFWGRTVRCSNPQCGKVISLSRIGWLSRKEGRSVFLVQRPDAAAGKYVRELYLNPTEALPANEWETMRGVTCPFCRRVYKKKALQDLTRVSLGSELVCVCVSQNGTKSYIVPRCQEDFLPADPKLQRELDTELNRIRMPLPSTELPCWSGIVNPALYGVCRHVQMFNARQLVVLLKVIRGLRETYKTLLREGHPKAVALAVTAALSGLIDQLVDWNSVISMWIPQNEQVGRALAGPGLPMLWDYVEIDPFSDAPANLYSKLKRIVEGLQAVPRFSVPVEVHCGAATALPFKDESFDAVITDPPYGDNLFYSVLSDCIYVWKRMVFKDLLPDLFESERTPIEEELVAAAHRHDSYEQAMSFYGERLATAIQEAARVLRPHGILSLVFTHSTLRAWEVVIRAFRGAGLVITACLPLALERRARPRGMNSKAINASVVIVARKRTSEFEIRDWDSVRSQIESEATLLTHELGAAGWDKADIGLVCFAKAAGIIAQCATVHEGSRELPLHACLERSAELVSKIVPSLPFQTRPNGAKRIRRSL